MLGGYSCVVGGGGSRSWAYSPTSAKVRVEALKQWSGSGEAAGCRLLAQERLQVVGAIMARRDLGFPLLESIRTLQQGDAFV